MQLLLTLISCLVLVSGIHGAALDEDYGYVDVRTGAHMFYVVYHTELAGDYSTHPLIMWLQGGPGASGVGYGNFQELGPYDINGNLRPGRWTQKANVMFVDNPVGTGYSYVDSSEYTTNNTQIADDLVTLMKSVFTTYPAMQVMPFFVYAESYGGKMTADFALALDRAIKNGEIVCNFQGVGLGDSWISPMDSVNTWGTYLYWMGFVNTDGQAAIDQAAANTQTAVDNGNWVQATNLWGITENVVLRETDGVDFYNVLVKDSSIYNFKEEINSEKYASMRPEIRELYFRHVMPMSKEERDALGDFMNGPQKVRWGIPDNVIWDSQGNQVFNNLNEDFMKPVVTSVADLLTNTNIHVAVYTGDLDLICDTPGTYLWIQNMDYPQKPDFEATERQALTITEYPNNAAYLQRFERLSLFTILRSGHMVPIDAPEMSLSMIDMITQFGAEAVGPASKKEASKPSKETLKTLLVDPHLKTNKADENVQPKVAAVVNAVKNKDDHAEQEHPKIAKVVDAVKEKHSHAQQEHPKIEKVVNAVKEKHSDEQNEKAKIEEAVKRIAEQIKHPKEHDKDTMKASIQTKIESIKKEETKQEQPIAAEKVQEVVKEIQKLKTEKAEEAEKKNDESFISQKIVLDDQYAKKLKEKVFSKKQHAGEMKLGNKQRGAVNPKA